MLSKNKRSKECASKTCDSIYFDFKILDGLLKETNNSDLVNEIIKTAKGGKCLFEGLYDPFGKKINNRSLEKLNCKVIVDSESGKIRLINKKHFKK